MEHLIIAGDPNVPAVAELLAASEAYAHSLYRPESVHMLNVRDLIGPSVRFLVAKSVTGIAAGCGAIVLGSGGFAELKRMYVAPEARGKGIGSMILHNLETAARAAGMCVIQLETGPLQIEAIALYRRFGYIDRGPFGAYKLDPLSLFMEKKLDTDLALSPGLR